MSFDDAGDDKVDLVKAGVNVVREVVGVAIPLDEAVILGRYAGNAKFQATSTYKSCL